MNVRALVALAGLVTLGGAPAPACTAICAAAKGKILAGNNEDFGNPRSRIWFTPAEKGKYGRLFVGFDNGFPQGGMNEKGLMFDGFAAPAVDLPPSPEKHLWLGSLGEKALAECATVGEVVLLVENLYRAGRVVYFFADASGDAAAIEPDG